VIYWVMQQLRGDNAPPLASVRAILAFVLAFSAVLATGNFIIRNLHRRGFRDLPRTYMDSFANSKSGTPTMGGLIIVFGIFIGGGFMCDLSKPAVALMLLSTIFFAGLGAVDDLLKIRARSSDGGLGRRTKILAQGGFGLFFAIIALNGSTSPFLTGNPPGIDARSLLNLPVYTQLTGYQPDIGVIWYGALIIVVFLSVTNAINLLDGLDGLTSVPTAFTFAFYGILAYFLSRANFATDLQLVPFTWSSEVAIYASAVVGALTGFLWFNCYPAEVFMGDTGSLSLGGTAAAVCILTKHELMFLIVGGIFLYTFISTMVQDIVGLKILGRRMQYRAPAHHLYQHLGWSETKVAMRYWIVSLMFALLGLACVIGIPRIGGNKAVPASPPPIRAVR